MPDFFKSWLYYLSPKRCAICREVLSFREVLCSDCEGKLHQMDKDICKRCGHVKKQCECKNYAYHFRGFTAPFVNEGLAQEGIYGFKFLRNRDAADFFATEIAKRVKDIFPDVEFDVVCAIPMYRLKRSVSGFDHAEILATEVARAMNLPYKRLLKKQKNCRPQHTLTAKERFENVKGVYTARKNAYENVLLIDDIKTTGATLDECARRLMLAGTENVYCAAAVISTCKDNDGKL